MLDIDSIFETFCLLSGVLVLLIILSHLLTNLYASLLGPTPVKLNKNSLVVLAGGCMGIGKEMALELARKYQCRLLLIDIRQDLFPETIK